MDVIVKVIMDANSVAINFTTASPVSERPSVQF